MKIRARKPTFRAAVQTDGSLELLVYEEIGENYWSGGGVTAKTVKQQLDQAGLYNRISMRINSPGGDAFEGIAIHNLLRAQGKPIDVFVDGIAASAASIVAMAGDRRVMGSNAMMMIHNAWSSCVGYAEDMRKMADTLDKVSNAVAQTYIDRAGMSADDAKEMMDAESWLGAQECVDAGLATEIAKDDENDDAAMALARGFKSLKRFKSLPKTLRNDGGDGDMEDACSCLCEQCQNGNCAGCDCAGCDSANCTAEACDCAGGAENSIRSEQTTKRVDGEDLPKANFAYQGSEKLADWKLPIKFSTDAKSADHIRNAIARWSKTDMPNADEKDKARARIKAAAKAHDIDIDEGSLNSADLSAYEAELEMIERQL